MVSAEMCGASASRAYGRAGRSIAMCISFGVWLEGRAIIEEIPSRPAGRWYNRPSRFSARFEIRKMEVIDNIRQTVQDNPIVLFMKGTPQFPMCGFSSRAVQALKSAGAQFAS